MIKRLVLLLSAVFVLTGSSLLAQGFGDDGGISYDDYKEEETDNGGSSEPASGGESGGSSEGSSEGGSDGGSDDGGMDSAGASSEDGESSFDLGFGVGSVTIDDTTWTRVRLFPQFKIKKFGMALDVELFINEEGKLTNKGWTFTSDGEFSPEATWETISRKIYYISWSSMNNVVRGNEKFHFKVGALERTTLGMGMIMRGYENTLEYPVEKKLGIQLAVGNISPLRIGLQAFLGDIGDFTRNGALVGGRFFLHPLGFMKSKKRLPNLQLGFTAIADVNQFAALKDTDGDSYPDITDMFEDDASKYADTDGDGIADFTNSKTNYYDIDADGDNILDAAHDGGTDSNVEYADYYSLEDKKDTYAIWGVDVSMPITKRLLWYNEFASGIDPEQEGVDTNKASGYGFKSGLRYTLGKQFLTLAFEYRRVSGQFRPGYFDRQYEKGRAFLAEDGYTILGKDSTIDDVNVNGFYGSLDIDIKLIKLIGYTDFLIDVNEVDDSIMSYGVTATVNREFVSQIEQLDKFLGDAEAYIQRDYVKFGDVKEDPEDDVRYFGKTLGFTAGAKLGIKLAETTQILYEYNLAFKYDSSGELVPDSKMAISTETSF